MKNIFTTLSIILILLLQSNTVFSQCCDFTVHQQIEPTTSAATFGVALGDFDGDGDNDAVAISAYYGIDVYFNDGNGTFTLNAQYATGPDGDFYGVHVCDVDGDTDQDIIAIPFYSSADLTILFNNGLGSFSTTSVSSNIATYNAAVGDIDGDNDIDVFLPKASGSSGKVFKNNGFGSFTLSQTVTGARGHDAELGDLDGDGDLDAFLVSNSSYGNSVLLNDGMGNFTVLGTPFSKDGSNVALGDLDNDGDLDAWVGTSGSISEVWLNDSNATFTLHATINNGSYCKAVNLYDFDNDGDLDVFLGFYSDDPQVWKNDDNLTFSLCYQATSGSSCHGQTLGFINNDNYIDIYSGYFSNSDGDYVFLNESPAISFANNPFCPYISTPQNVILAGNSGGTFSTLPTGLDIDTATGDIIPSSSLPGTYKVVYSLFGCNVSTMVTINSLDLSTYTNADTIFAMQDSATYQWVDCNNAFSAIPGETDQYFKVSANGDYAVIISYDGCTDTSACVNMVVTDLYEIAGNPLLSIFPNPNDGQCKLAISNLQSAIEMQIMSIHGQMIHKETILNISPTYSKDFDLSMLAKGVYFIHLRGKGYTITRKLIIK
jgi:hypothetical protein